MICTHAHRPVANARRNPLRMDPTRTTLLRRAFITDLRKRFAGLRRAVRDFILDKDALGLAERKSFVVMVQPREYEFRTSADKLKAFNEWFRQQVEAGIFSVPPGTDPTEPWTAKYVDSAYRRGIVNAFIAARGAELLGLGVEEFLRASFGRPERLSKARLLATRSFESLRGITAYMSSQLNRILAQGIIDGRSISDLAKQMTDEIDGLTRQRAFVLARTEIISAHAEGQLDSFEELGIEQLGILAEFSTARDEAVCPICLELEGRVYTIAEARGVIPVHPNCRCAWTVHIPESVKSP